tara:strand:- start:10480 stop:12183 length:1704 start_codon:yes stop_codon:yes gene_type:complete
MKNFVNPKKIKGQDKLDRIKDLMGKMSTLNESTSLSEIENVKKGANGVIYGIIRENHSYFIKTTEKTSGTLVAEDFNYIGGLQNKNIEKYGSYAEALKQLNLKFDMLNESFGIKSNTNLFESDAVEVKEANASGVVVKEEPEVIEDQKTVIKVDAPKSEPAPVEDEVGGEDPFADEEGGEDPFADEEGGEEEISMDVEEEGEEDGDGYTKKIQKLTGKIGQMLRDKDEPDAELDKYVINSIVSAIDWEEIPDEDVEDIIAKIEGEDEEDGELEGGDEVGGEDPFADEEGGEDPFADEEGGEEELAESEEIKEEKETINISKKQMEMLKKDGKCDCGDVTLKLDESDDELEEGNKFSGELAKAKKEGKDEFEVDGKTYKVKESRKFSKKQLMENFLKKNINESLNKILKENELVCEVCGEMHEGDCHVDEDLDITNQTSELAGDDVGVVHEENMSVVDAIATGQNYLQASGDLDRDGDQIPNRLDMDSNMDGDLDHPTFDDEEFIEIDFDSLMGNSPAPTKEPGIAPPSTRPGKKKPRWKKIPRPEVNPKPKATDRRKFHLGRKGMYR